MLIEDLEATEAEGTRHRRMEEFARLQGLTVTSGAGYELEQLESHLRDGNLVIVAMQAWHDEDDLKYDYAEEWEDGKGCV